MNIVFILEHYYPYIGGAERLFQMLAESMATEQHEVTVLTTKFNKTLASSEKHNGVNILRIQCYNRFLFTFLSLPKVIQYARKADLIHTTTYNAALPAWLGARLTRKKVIVTFHEVWDHLWFRLPFASLIQKTAYHLFEKILLQLSFDHYIAVSDFTKKALINNGIDPIKVSRIYNGLDYEEFTKKQHRPPVQFTYTYFGRLGISKGLDLLLPAAKLFSVYNPHSQLILILPKQPMAMYKKIKALVEGLQLSDHVVFRHELSREDLYQQICDSSCVVIPSYSEGFCFVAAEAVALGVPIISSGQGALKEVVCGKMIEMEQMSIESLYTAIKQASLGEWIEKPIQFFQLNDALSAHFELIKRLKN